jgi:hypothetical protein
VRVKVYLTEVRSGDTDWIKVAQDRVKWRAFMNTVINFHVINEKKLSPPAE